MVDNLPTDHSESRRILSIDGGGLLGTFPVSFLAGLEEHIDQPIGRYFDLIAGTSTGGIIAIGLALGLRASEILEFYEECGPEIFGQDGSKLGNSISRIARGALHLAQPKHNSEKLKDALSSVLGERRIGEAQTRLVIPAWNPEKRSVYIYKTAHHPRLQVDYKDLAIDAAMATASAPTYFHQHITRNDVGLIDGGVWANNPVGVAVVEAISMLNWSPKDLQVLSLGCLDEVYSLPKRGGMGQFGLKLVKLFTDGQAHGAMGIAKLLTGHEHEREAIHRIDHTVNYGEFKLDDARVIRELKGIGFDRARDRLPAMQRIFLQSPAEPFEPFYKLDVGDGQ